ncbi:MAG: hypothetical protein N2319_10670 [Candidatus Kapabacteria bacterium]|nr:hypothetical protein [Candidatus Kapabacteria bacterium]
MSFFRILILSLLNILILYSSEPKILFIETFEDNNFASRGWYDHLRGKITSDEHIEGSNYSLELKFIKGETTPEGGTPGRVLFEETDEVCISYYVKYSKNFIGSGKSYHPHEFHFITNKDSKWVGPAFTHLTTYIEQNNGYPLLAIQDGENIDQSRVGQNLVGITENRSVAGCNGSSDGYPDDCYKSGDRYVNGKQWKTKQKFFSDEQGKYYKNDWHHIIAYFKLNSILDGIGINDGILKYWFDGELILDYNNVTLRTGKHPDMKFNQFLLAPYIGDGSPIDQTMWIDNLTISTKPIISSVKNNIFVPQILISPNPASDYIEINCDVESGLRPVSANEINIYNILGECVLSTPALRATPHEGIFRIDISNLPNGSYFINVGNYYGKFMVLR